MGKTVNPDLYEIIMESVPVYDGKFMCAYTPMCGLVKIENTIYKILAKEGIVFNNYTHTTIKYIIEKVYLNEQREKITEKEIYELLAKG